ncbi:Cys-tRNA(Pro) deacylase, partial [Mycobacterium sp. ITM-2017-0098]
MPVARAATPAIAALVAAGVAHEVVQYRHDPRSASFGEEAVNELAQAGDLSPAQILKTLVVALPKG